MASKNEKFDSPKRDYTLEKKFISIAQKDLEASEILYNRGIYSLAVYHLQQSVEKTAKAWGLFLGIISDETVKEIGHITPRTYLELFESKIGKISQILSNVSHEQIQADIGAYRYLINKNPIFIAKIDYDGIKIQLDIIPLIYERIAEETKKTFKNFRLPEDFFDISIDPLYLYLLSNLTYPHHQFTRYPGLSIEPSEYNENLGIVKALPELIEITKNCIKELLEKI